MESRPQDMGVAINRNALVSAARSGKICGEILHCGGSDQQQPHQNRDVQRCHKTEHPLDRAQFGPLRAQLGSKRAHFRAQCADAVLRRQIALPGANRLCNRLGLGPFEASGLQFLRSAQCVECSGHA